MTARLTGIMGLLCLLGLLSGCLDPFDYEARAAAAEQALTSRRQQLQQVKRDIQELPRLQAEVAERELHLKQLRKKRDTLRRKVP